MNLRSLLVLFAAVLLFAAACGDAEPSPVLSCRQAPPSTQADASAFPVTVEDSTGDSVTLEAPPSAIASLSAGHTEILYALGAGGQVVAVDKTSDCPQAVSQLPQVDAFSPSAEAIAGLNADLVVLFFGPADLKQSLEQLGLKVLLLNSPESVQGVYEQVTLLGRATGHATAAEDLVERMQDDIERLQDGLPDGEGPRVFHEIDSTYYTAGPGSFIGDLYSLLRARNIADATGQAYPQISAEAIIQADPEVILLADEDAGESPATVAARPGWGEISAVKNARVHVVDPDIVSRPGPRLVDALQTLARLLYPEQFE